MSRLLLTVIVVLATLGVVAGMPAKATETCSVAAEKFDQARSAGDLETIIGQYADLSSAGCSEQVLYCAGNNVALAYLNAGYATADDGSNLNDVKAKLLQGKAYGSPWQLLVGLGDLALSEARSGHDGQLFDEAAAYYQNAINTISETPICTDSSGLPNEVEIKSIHQRMSVALMLAPDFEIARTRDGGCGGIFLQSIRGFTPTFRPLPITFEFDKAEFTTAGAKAAGALLACLMEEAPQTVTLSGHTDEKGTEEYNMGLSERRLQRVASYLKDGGFTGKLILTPRGESEPFVADDPKAYSEAEIDQLNRRVALRETTP